METTNQPSSFTVGHCSACAADVLTYVDFDANGALVHNCLGCGAALHEDLQSVSPDQLAEHGYEIAAPGSCGSGGCGSCGVRPAAAATHELT